MMSTVTERRRLLRLIPGVAIPLLYSLAVFAQNGGDIPYNGSLRVKSLSNQTPSHQPPRSANQSVVVVLPGNGSTSNNGRAPQGSRLFVNSKYLITAAEMSASGFAGNPVTSVGWRWNAPRPAGAGAPVAQSVATTGNLKVFLKDTTADATGLIGTFIDTNGVGYTKVIDSTISLTRTDTLEFTVDVPAGGPGTGTYTPTPGNGVLVIFVYNTTTPIATPLGAPTVFCTSVGAILTYQSQTVNGTTGSPSTFRPETRFGTAGAPPLDIVQVPAIYALGKMPIPIGNPDDLKAPVSNVSTSAVTFDLTVTVKSASTGTVRFTSTQNVASLAAGTTSVISFPGWSPTITEDDSIVVETSAIPGETLTSNNRLAMLQTVNTDTFSYAQGPVPSGGVGFNGATGDFVARFSPNAPTTVDQVEVSFAAGGQPYNIGIWDANGTGGTPGTNLFTSASLTSVTGATAIPISPPVAVSGSFFAGVKQTGTTNLSFAYQTETPIRSSTFYFTSPSGGTTWTDFAPNNSFRFMIEPRVTGTAGVGETPGSLPKEFSLSQNYPDPFNPSTTIGYQVPASGFITLKVFDVLGREVATLVNGVEDPGFKSVRWNATHEASGVYIYRLQAGDFVQTRKLLLLR